MLFHAVPDVFTEIHYPPADGALLYVRYARVGYPPFKLSEFHAVEW
jgi:hypothetical protein